MRPYLDFTESQTLAVLRSFLISVVPIGVEVVQGQVNRVAEPIGPDFVVFTPLLRERLATNIHTYADTFFTGSINGTILTVTAVAWGELGVGRQIFGVGVAPDTRVTALGSATTGVGTYTLNNPQSLPSQALAGGINGAMVPTKYTVQVDVHGPSGADNAQIISTLLRDEFALDKFAEGGLPVVPLFAEDPRQMPFLNEQQQVETRWTIGAVLQCNPTVVVPLEFASSLGLGLINVDVVYPPLY